ncbi:hypothetical protein [Haliscomenobacter hydrossis]|uniref:Uncharacterized protein n=1 Tax=Haliscomenobacter hydrossis (strain ATCC 27775 / DSM 1100 / LMG 10767 / O) TaxID=760192 RepID=F4KQG1_HALH1|nr:hypothetical protein [Haliscomenobacter hydrossis]AEE49950.1 hypothetical protein Halhy_2065 [Haliscomenobacter hydrossis DSM 1100]
MTLRDLLVYVGNHPESVVLYFAILPIAALLLAWIAGAEGRNSPWNYLYSAIIYLSAVPGIFALSLNIYIFLFERGSILNLDIYTQLLPILSMILTLGIVRRNVDLSYVPGFGKLSGLLMLIGATIALMWLVDRTRIYAIISMPFSVVILIFVVLMLVLRFGYRQTFGRGYRS